MWTVNYILSQVAVAIAVIFMAVSYQAKDKKWVLIFCLLSCVFYMMEYLLIGAYGGLVANMVGFIRTIWLYFDEQYNLKDRFVILITISLCLVVCTLVTYTGWWDISICASALLFNFSVWQKDIKIYRWLAVVVSVLYIIYNVAVHTIMGTVFEVVLMAFEIIGIVRLYVKPKQKVPAMQDVASEQKTDMAQNNEQLNNELSND